MRTVTVHFLADLGRAASARSLVCWIQEGTP